MLISSYLLRFISAWFIKVANQINMQLHQKFRNAFDISLTLQKKELHLEMKEQSQMHQ